MLSRYVFEIYEIILHKKIICVTLVQRAQTCLQENNLSNVVFTNIAQENYLRNVDIEPMNNFAQENNLECCLDLCGQT